MSKLSNLLPGMSIVATRPTPAAIAPVPMAAMAADASSIVLRTFFSMIGLPVPGVVLANTEGARKLFTPLSALVRRLRQDSGCSVRGSSLPPHHTETAGMHSGGHESSPRRHGEVSKKI